ncbi:MMPL family transporter [Streptomyces sp. NPDC058469]|uniref:MMPL family transporter n=1 Tax=Streptomyces sp. NPDC058469 TaxID=3346514 RepID=UPI00364AFE2F
MRHRPRQGGGGGDHRDEGLFGLAMDFEVFLASRMREHHENTLDLRQAVVHGVTRRGRVVGAPALVIAAVFAGFIFNEDPVVKSIGLALAVGVLIDAFVVRVTPVPAATGRLGYRAWTLSRRRDRALPDVDIEGAYLPDHTEKKDSERSAVPEGETSAAGSRSRTV